MALLFFFFFYRFCWYHLVGSRLRIECCFVENLQGVSACPCPRWSPKPGFGRPPRKAANGRFPRLSGSRPASGIAPSWVGSPQKWQCCSLFLSVRIEYPCLLWTPTFMIAELISWTLKVSTSSFPMERRTTVCVGVHSVEPVDACCRGGVHVLASLSWLTDVTVRCCRHLILWWGWYC